MGKKNKKRKIQNTEIKFKNSADTIILSPMNIKINHKILLNIRSSEYPSHSKENQNNSEFEKEENFSYFEPFWKIEQLSEILISQFQFTVFLDYRNIEKIIN